MHAFQIFNNIPYPLPKACQLYKKQAGADSPHPIACTLTAKLIYAALE